MFKQFASSLLSLATLSMAGKLKCDKNAEEGTTCAEIYQEAKNDSEILLFPQTSAMLKLSAREIKDTKKSGHKGKCHWQLKVTTDKATGAWNSLQAYGGKYEFDGFTVTQKGKCEHNTWLIEAAEAATGIAPNATDLEFINSCDIKPESDKKERRLSSDSDSDFTDDDEPNTTDQEEQMEYDNPMLFNTRVQIISTEDTDGGDV